MKRLTINPKAKFKSYLIKIFLLVATIPLAISAMLTLPNLFNHLQQDVLTQNATLARAMAVQSKLFLQRPKLVMSVIIEDINSHTIFSPIFIEDILEDAIRTTQLFDALYLLDSKKDIIAIGLPPDRQDHRNDFQGMQMGHKPFVKKATQTGQAVWSDTFLSATSANTSAALAIPMPNNYMLIGDIDLSQLSNFLAELQSAEEKTTIILDTTGQIIAHPIKKLSARQINLSHLKPVQLSLLGGKHQSMEFSWDGKKYLGTAVPITGPDWIALVYESKESATKQLHTTTKYYIIATLLALFGSLWLAVYLSREVASPIETMAGYAERIAQGDYKHQLPRSEFFELNQLSYNLSLMADAVALRERQLEAGEKRYRSIFNATSDALIIQDAENAKILDVNNRTLQLYQYNRETILRKTIADLSSPLQNYSESFVMEQFAKAKQGQQVVFEWLAKDSNNQTFPVEVSLSYAEIDKHQRIIASVRNIRKRKEAENEIEKNKQKYFHQEKIAALGQMIAGVLHEIGNPISAISGIIEQLYQLNKSEDMDGDCQQLKKENAYYLEMIKAHSDRLEGITKEVANFVSPQITECEFFDLNSMVERSRGLLRYEKKLKYIEKDYHLDKNISAISAVQEHVVQVFLNLMLNASSACQNLPDRTALIMVRTEMDDEYVVLSITDNGIGMSEEVQDNALTPFFTTKKAGAGTGLGLSLCKSLIEEQKGELEITSIEGIGTEVRVYLAGLSDTF